jgi:eukaryotic-like serine/threonine-protein kinase
MGSLIAGSQISAYQLLSPIGRGGMGEVHLALDTRLGRKVALKLLPAAFTTDSARLQRFAREARAASALNHPNIITIHEIGETETENGSLRYIVTEYVEGETLRQRMASAPQRRMKPLEAIEIALQISAALSAAHEAGITHRDIKPENVMLRRDGIVKVLDFGLAKLTEKRPAAVDSRSLTIAKVNTNPGTVLGTVGYMAPEQVRGQEADHRADIFSFGVILYEMLSGRGTFSGESAVEVMNAILKEEPPELGESNAKISPALDKIVRRCLEKKPDRRFHSAHDLGFALEALSTPSDSRLETATVLPAAPERAGSRRLLGNARLAWIVAGLFLLLALAALSFLLAYLRRAAADERVFHVRRAGAGEDESFCRMGPPAISPDGRLLAFVASTADDKRLLWVRPLDYLIARPLAGTDEAIYPFWSPNSRTIGFFARGSSRRLTSPAGLPKRYAMWKMYLEAPPGTTKG